MLTKNSVSTDDVLSLCMPSGVNKNLDLLIAGPIPPNPSELLTRSTLKEIFDILRKEYDYVIVDTAPVGLVTDTLHIGKVADATVMVCRADYTEKSSFSMINDFAENNKLPNVSIVVNGVDMSKKKYGYAYEQNEDGLFRAYYYSRSWNKGALTVTKCSRTCTGWYEKLSDAISRACYLEQKAIKKPRPWRYYQA